MINAKPRPSNETHVSGLMISPSGLENACVREEIEDAFVAHRDSQSPLSNQYARRH